MCCNGKKKAAPPGHPATVTAVLGGGAVMVMAPGVGMVSAQASRPMRPGAMGTLVEVGEQQWRIA